MPRVKLRSNAGIIKRTCCKIKMNSPRRVIDYAIFEKTPQLIRRHYTRRKQLFITAKVLLRKKSLHQQIKKQLVYLNLKKKWLKFLSNYTSTTLDLAMQQAHNNHTNLARQLNKFITIIGKKNIYGTYDFIPQE